MEICNGIVVNPLPKERDLDSSIPHAPVRTPNLNKHDKQVSASLD